MAAARVICFWVILIACSGLQVGCKNDTPERLTINGETFLMELAIDEDTRTKGMSGRDRFPDGGGMLFVFPDAQVRNFWMFECLIDIDIIFVDSRGTVTAIHRMPAEPLQGEDESIFEYEARLPRYSSRYPAQFAIELPAGSIDRLQVRVEDRIDLDLERLKAMAK